MHRIAVAVLPLALVACSSEDAGPGDFGEACSGAGECVGELVCNAREVCVGRAILPGAVFFPDQDQPADELHVAVFFDRDEGVGDPLIPSRAPYDVAFPAPVSYPVSFQLNLPPGAWDLVAYVPQPESTTLRGQVSVDVDAEGGFTVNGATDDRVSIQITGSSGIQYE